MNHTRLSINGWFHSDQIPLEEPPSLPTPTFGLFAKNSILPGNSTNLEDFISPMYLIEKFATSINKQIEKNSEISLEKFFDDDFYDNVSNELQKVDDSCWKMIGPPNRRHYEICDESNFTENIQKLFELFKSKNMFELMKKYTELELVPGDGAAPSMRFELQRWKSGSYSVRYLQTFAHKICHILSISLYLRHCD